MKRSAAASAAAIYTSICMGAAQVGSPELAIDRALEATYVTTVLLQRTVCDDPYSIEKRRRVDEAVRQFEAGLAAAAEQMTA